MRDQMVGPVAGAGRRLRGHAGRLRGLRRRSDGDGRAHAARRRSTRRRRAAWRSARRSPTCSPRRSSSPRVKLSAQLDGRVRRAGRGRGAVRHGAAPSAWSCARRSASASRSARIACRCARSWSDAAATAKQVTSPVSPDRHRRSRRCDDVRAHADAAARTRRGDTTLIAGRPRPRPATAWAARMLAQVHAASSATTVPDLDDPQDC